MHLTSPNLAHALTKLVAVDALPLLMSELVMGNLVTRDFEPVEVLSDDTVDVLPPAPLAKPVPIILDQHAEASFTIPDVSKVIAVPDLLQLYMRPALQDLAEKIETDLLHMAGNLVANKPIGEPGAPLTVETVDAAEAALYNARADWMEQKYLVLGPAAYQQLRQHHLFFDYLVPGESGLKARVEGPVGKFRDFFVLRSRHATAGLAFTQSALGMAIRRLPKTVGAFSEYAELSRFGIRVVMEYRPSTLQQKFTVDVLYGVGVLRPEWGVQVWS